MPAVTSGGMSFHRVTNGEVGRAPNDIDGSEGQRQLDGIGPVVTGCALAGGGHDHRPASYVYHLFSRDPVANQGLNLGGLMAEHILTYKTHFTG